MPVYDEGWEAAKGEVSFEVTSRHQVDIYVSCTKTVQVLGVPETPGQAAVVLKTGEEFRFHAPLFGFKKVCIRGTGQTPFGLKLRHIPRMNGEPNSGEKAPVIELPEPSNLVAKMRRMSEEHHRMMRYPVMEPEDGPSLLRYELEDEDDALFEEEILAKRQAEAKEKAEAEAKEKAEAEAKARKDAEAKAAHGEPEPAKGAKEAKPRSEPPPPAQAAE